MTLKRKTHLDSSVALKGPDGSESWSVQMATEPEISPPQVSDEPVSDEKLGFSLETLDCGTWKIRERSTIGNTFNVMPGRGVTETLFVKEYRVTGDWVEATFDRKYESEMRRSPDHLIFTSTLYQTQKLMYLALCKRLGYSYSPTAPEVLKIWPYHLNIDLPQLHRGAKDVVQRLEVVRLEPKGPRQFDFEVLVTVGKSQRITVRNLVKLIEKKETK